MARGRHARSGPGKAPLILLVVLGVLGVSVAGSAFVAYGFEQQHADRMLPGVRVAGINVSGMTRKQAMEAVAPVVERKLARKITVSVGDRSWRVSVAELGMAASPEAAVERALKLTGKMSWLSRVYHRVSKTPVDRKFWVEYGFNPAPIDRMIERIQDDVAVEAQNASYDLDGYEVLMTHAKPGRALEADRARELLQEAVLEGRSSVVLPTGPVQADVTDDEVGNLIVVNRANNTLRFYDDFELVRQYDVATAAYGYETPPGEWTIYNKVENPTWVNGAKDTWGADLPDVIPPGPGNPLGTRALYVDAPGIRIHGTYDSGSIGSYASHGCIRMLISESEELYPQVPIGTSVFVIGDPPWGDFVFPDTDTGV